MDIEKEGYWRKGNRQNEFHSNAYLLIYEKDDKSNCDNFNKLKSINLIDKKINNIENMEKSIIENNILNDEGSLSDIENEDDADLDISENYDENSFGDFLDLFNNLNLEKIDNKLFFIRNEKDSIKATLEGSNF